jgi:hypothetical protein
MTIKSFPFGIPFSSSFAVSASHAKFVENSGSLSASLAEFVIGFTGPTGPPAITIDNGGQFVYL